MTNAYDTNALRKFWERTIGEIDDEFIFPRMEAKGLDPESPEWDTEYEVQFEEFMEVFLPHWKFTPPQV